MPKIFRHVYTMILVIIGWTIFAQTDFSQMGSYLAAMFGAGAGWYDSSFLYYLKCNGVLLLAAVLCSLDWAQMMGNRMSVRKQATSRGQLLGRTVVMVVALGLSLAFLVGDSYNPFLYFRF